jgi:hypothetical protein
MSKPTKKELLQQLLDLEDNNLGEVGKTTEESEEKVETIYDKEEITKPKKKLTEKQLEALRKGQQTRDANAKKRKEEAERIAAEEKKILEEKIVRKAISIKKKQIKKQAALDEIEDDDTPIQKIKSTIEKSEAKVELIKPKINFF